MTRRVLRVLVEVEGTAFDPDDSNPYAESQAELESVLGANLQVITSMDAGDVVTLRDTNGNRCGKVECEDFPGNSPLLPYWAKLSDLALDVEEEFPVAKFLDEEHYKDPPPPPPLPEPGGQKSEEPEPKVAYNEEAARAFDEGKVVENYPGTPSSHEHIAERDPEDPVIQTRPRKSRPVQNANVPSPPGDPGMK